VPKAKPFSDGDEDERTTIESQWEEEASTTVEQGDVADKIKSLGGERRGNTNVTHTGAMDEPTVDDQHAPVLSAITPLRADQNARLSITQGNDTGQTFEIRPGKTYTIGRAIDNDVVLTDIAVSRKHFDLRHEDGAWVIVDHGSGNGTVVNGNVEDNPFMLANGDTIEIGNTVFRFEQEKGPVRPQQRTMDLPEEEEELSTVAGKPLRPEIIEVEPAPTPVVTRPQRPKTLPPPMPMRSVGASQPPPIALPPQPLPASTLPLPQMANRPPMGNPGMPTMLGDPHGRPLPGMPPQQNGMPTTLPGQPVPPRPSYPYPQATEIPPHSVHAQMLLVQSQNRRGDASTAHVPPMSYDPMFASIAQPQQRYTQPQLSARAKYIIAGAGLALLAAIATIGIVKSSSAKPKPTPSTTSGSASQPPKKKAGMTVEAIKPDAPKKGPMVEAINTKAIAKAEAPKQEPWKPDAANQEPAKVEPPKQEPPKQEPPKQETKKQEPAKVEPPKQEPAKVEPPKQDTKKQEPAKAEPPKQDTKKQEPAKVEPPKQEPPKQEAKQEPKKQETKQEPKKIEARTEPKKREPKVSTPAPKKVAAAVDTSGAKAKADDLYRRKKFNDASSVLVAAAKSADDDEAKELNTTAEYYSKLGKALNQGTAPATEPVVAFENLRKASNYDKNVGSFFEQDISTRLAQVAPKAAYSYLAKKMYQQARTAVLEAERYGNSDGVSIVRVKLESVARDLYDQAKSDGFESNNSKDKLKQIKLIVDSKSPWYQKAQKALGG